ncbi:MAG: molybdopterin-dependent oxidoreductase [Isosphaeraceae bacterium]
MRIDGAVEAPGTFGKADLAAIAGEDPVPDVSVYQPARRGAAVRLEGLLRAVRPLDEANYLTLHAGRDDFHVSIPLGPVRGEAVVVYEIEGRALTASEGGPFRFLILNPAACHTAELDDCANVKYLDRIELRVRPGRDTRPRDEAEHAALHAREQGERLSGS